MASQVTNRIALLNAVRPAFKMKDIINVIRNLSCSQGMYGRLLCDLAELKENNPEAYKKLSKEWESKEFRSTLDFVMFYEG